jgi:hypothetical protein
MVAIVQSNPYACLSRKIGYSVGLENLLENVLSLAAIYVERRDVSFSNWRDLVVKKFERGERAVLEIANFFGTLNLIKLMGRELHVLHALDSVAILRQYFKDDDAQYRRSVQFILLKGILEADGDVFLNCVTANFEADATAKLLEEMVRWKWERLKHLFKNPAAQRPIWDIVSIRSQLGGTGHKDAKTSPFAPRGGPSPFEPRRDPIDAAPSLVFEVAESYLRKILPTRKGWAKDLGLLANSEVTTCARTILMALPQIGIGVTGGPYYFWPYAIDLGPIRLSAKDLGIEPISEWQVLKCLGESVNSSVAPQSGVADDDEAIIEQLAEFHTLYKAASASRGSIRHQLPLYIAQPLVVASAVARQAKIPPLQEIIAKETHSAKRRLMIANIRGTEGGLVFHGVRT